MNWRMIRLELAKAREFPKGSVACAYLVRLPIDPDGQIDVRALVQSSRRATICRFWPSEPDQWGYATLEASKIRIFSGRNRKYLQFADAVLTVGGRVHVLTPDDEQMEFRISSIDAR